MRIFRQVIAAYQVFKSNSGLTNFGGMKNLEDVNNVSNKYFRSGQPTPLDFICDIELIIKKDLPPAEQSFFSIIFILNYETATNKIKSFLGDKTFHQLKYGMEERLGKIFKRKQVFPVKKYFKLKI
jgi:hypothetical protein